MDTVGAILLFLKSLPDLIKLVQELMTFLKHASGDDAQGYVKKVGAAMAELNKAQSHEERQNAAQSIASAISGLP